VGITAVSREVPGRYACDRRHTNRIIIIIIIIIITLYGKYRDVILSASSSFSVPVGSFNL